MGTSEDTMTPAGRYLQQRMDDLGYRTKADLADTANVSRSTITRLFKNPDYRPDVDVMRRLARGLRVEHDELVAAIYGEAEATEPQELHPLAAELGRTLGPESPLTESEKALQELLVDLTLNATRRQPRVRIENRGVTVVSAPTDTGKSALVRGVAERLAAGETVEVDLSPNGGPLQSRLFDLVVLAQQLPPADYSRLLASVDMTLEWVQAKLDATLTDEERTPPQFLTDAPTSREPARPSRVAR